MMTATQPELLDQWQQAEQQPFTGWDFSYLAGRMLEDSPPWSYLARAAALMNGARSVLDLDTGGGERFLSLQAHWPPKVVVTEGWPSNFTLASERLTPLGITVVNVQVTEDNLLPFAAGEFDLVLNRHAAFNAAEVARILAPGGAFLTQQVHGRWAEDLLAAFDAKPEQPDDAPEKHVLRLEATGLTIVTAQEWQGRLQFTDVDAIVYYLKAVPWLVSGFTVASHLPYLLKLQSRLEAGEALTFTARKYLLAARKAL